MFGQLAWSRAGPWSGHENEIDVDACTARQSPSKEGPSDYLRR